MFTTYLKITLRNLYREKLYALINLFGLALGIGCCIILGLYVNTQLGYDKHFEGHENVYRIVNEYNFSGDANQAAFSSNGVGPLLKLDNPELIDSYIRFNPTRDGGEATIFRHETDAFLWDNTYIADTNLFEFLQHDIIYGDPATPLAEQNSIAVSETFARTYFGDENPIGRTLSTDLDQYSISLVFADLPENTHLKYDVIFSMELNANQASDPASLQRSLGNIGVYTYVRVGDNFDQDDLSAALNRLANNRVAALAQEFGMDFSVRFWPQPMADVHLDSSLEFDLPTGNVLYIYGFSAVAIFILLIACINYINLATARSLKRAKEVGMRKVLGADRSQLVLQFLAESLFFVLAALAMALAAAYVLIEYNLLGAALGQEIFIGSLFQARLLLILVALTAIVGILSGLYPAFYLSSVAPMAALSSGSKNSKSGSGKLRQVLVFIQFAISIGIISSTLLMANQMRFIAQMPLGFEKENKLLVPMRGADVVESLPAIRNELSTVPNILAVSSSGNLPGGQAGLQALYFDDDNGATAVHPVSVMAIGEDFIDVMGIEMLQGRSLSQKLLTDVDRSILVNQALVNEMGWSQPIGQPIKSGAGGVIGRVVGVTDDYHFASLYQDITPLIMVATQSTFENVPAESRPQITSTLVLNISSQNMSETLEVVRDTMQRFDPTHPFEYEFLDVQLDALYRSEQSVMSLTGIFSAICVFISCLGLFGLASFTTEQRTKEIGVRKVLGSSSWQIIVLLSRSILSLVLVGAVVASIASFFAVSEWLNSFAYRDSINPLFFLIATTLAIVVAFITVALQSYRTASANPVQALRYE